MTNSKKVKMYKFTYDIICRPSLEYKETDNLSCNNLRNTDRHRNAARAE